MRLHLETNNATSNVTNNAAEAANANSVSATGKSGIGLNVQGGGDIGIRFAR